MKDLLIFILDLLGGWAWLTIGILFIIGTVVALVIYAREEREWRVMLYSIRNFAGLLLAGLFFIFLAFLKGF